MTSIWQPQPTGLEQLLAALRSSDMSSNDTQKQKEITETLDTFNRTVPDYTCYLAYILCFLPSEEARVRHLSGLLLKNNVRDLSKGAAASDPAMQSRVLDYVKAALLESEVLGDPVSSVRNTAGTVVTTCVLYHGPEAWPEAIGKLIDLTNAAGAPNSVYGAFQTLSKICEDVPRKLETMQINGYQVLDIMIPCILQHLRSTSDPKIRIPALSCIHPFIPSSSQGALKAHLREFVMALFRCASDSDPEVRKQVCMALVGLLSSSPDILIPDLSQTVEFMLYSTQDADDSVALEACEFWLTMGEDARLKDHLKGFLGRVIPVLLKGMIYGEAELAGLDVDEEDEAVPDRAQDIKPRFYGGKEHGMSGSFIAGENEGEDGGVPKPGSKSREGVAGGDAKPEEEAEGSEDSDDYEDSDDEEMYAEWNLRKCSAAALDVIAVSFGEEMLQPLLPILKDYLFDTEWTHKEAGVLALGAIAEGCAQGMEPHMGALVPLLLASVNDRKALVRSISCWTLGRYANWIIAPDSTPQHKNSIFLPTMEALLHRVIDSNKRVQEAACSAFATLEEEAGEELEPYLLPVLQGLVRAFHKYQQKNLLILYDALGTLADAVGMGLAKPELLNVLMPPLIDKWQSFSDHDHDLIPVLECISSIAVAIGPSFVPYAQPVFDRCVRITRSSLDAYALYVQSPQTLEPPDKTFLIVALDLLSGLTQGLGPQSVALYQASQPPVFPLLGQCLNAGFPEPAVRQSAFALVGDCAISCYELLEPYLPQYLPQIIVQINVQQVPGLTSVCNNAAWAAGEIAVRAREKMAQYVEPLMGQLLPVLTNPATLRSLKENSAVTIGRLSLACPDMIAPSLAIFIKPWCQALAEIKDNEEKDSSFRGMCEAIERNPSGLNDALGWWLNAVGRWNMPSPDLLSKLKHILVQFKMHAGETAWNMAYNQLSPQTAQRLTVMYGV